MATRLPVPAQGEAATASGQLSIGRICDTMRERWHVDVTLRRETIFFESHDLDTCVIRQTSGTHIERRMSRADDEAAARALSMNFALCRQGFAFGVRRGVLVLHRYVAPWESFETCMTAVREFLVVSDRIKQSIDTP
ncbi:MULTISPECIES: hypothetical protein [Pandoraea]|uniref:hypothetical protein n=1 Tax=Pandoraea TaxID=93217 RepID=UPI001F5D35BF|nr:MULTISPECIES: hypothetical protein [Pandoraea]MCI3207308.1 hypothetical protein [Pandoraea sp. LA3]MDN4585337.1 hypothetical protein [Pandoraea capi]